MLINSDGTANTKYFSQWTTPGTFGQKLYIPGAWFWSFDASLNKDIPIREHLRLSLQAEFLNVLNHPEFDLPTAANLSPTSSTFGQVNSVMNGNAPRNIQLRGYLRW